MKKYLLFLTFFVLLANVCYSQNKKLRIYIAQEEIDSIMALVKPKYKWMGTEGLTVADKLKMKYRKPKGFRQDGASECFKDYPNLERTFGCEDHRLHSKDGQFLSFLSFVYFTEDFKRLYPLSGRKEPVDTQLYWQRRGIIKRYYGDEIGDSWIDSVTVYSTEEARSKWNADSAFVFNQHLRPEDYYKKDFKHVKILLIQKKGRGGYAYIISFYTDKAKENFDKYWRRIEKTLWFEK